MIIWEKTVYNGNTFGLDSEVSLYSYRLLATTGRQKLTRFAATNWEADWFLGCWNYFMTSVAWSLLLLTVGLFSPSWRVEKGLSWLGTCLSVCNMYDDTVQFFHITCAPLHKCELAVAMPPSAAKPKWSLHTNEISSNARFLNSKCWTNIFSVIDGWCTVVTK